MKLLICLTFIAIVAAAQALTDEQKAKWKKWSDECQAETGVTKEAIDKIKANDFHGADDKIKAHSLCFGKKSGMVSESGELNTDDVRAKLKRVVDNDEDVEKIIKQCLVTKSTPQETTFEAFKCLRENRSKFSPV